MEQVLPWERLLTLIEPIHPRGGGSEGGCPPVPLERMLRSKFRNSPIHANLGHGNPFARNSTMASRIAIFQSFCAAKPNFRAARSVELGQSSDK